MERDGKEPTDDDIARILSEWKDVTETPPKGAPKKAVVFIVVWILLICGAALVYTRLRPVWVAIWETPDNWYALKYRWLSSRVWALSDFVAAHRWILIPITAFGPLVWPIQQRLSQPRATLLFDLLMAFEILLGLSIFFCYTCLLLGPIKTLI